MAVKPKSRPSVFNIYCDEISKHLEEDDVFSPDSPVKQLYPHQIEAVFKARDHLADLARTNMGTIALVVLPTGCGKSGIAVLASFVLNAKKVLVITPSITITKQLYDDFCDSEEMFLVKRGIIEKENALEFTPRGVEVCKASDFPKSLHYSLVVANAQKFGTTSCISIKKIRTDCFDLVIVDEAHHYPADTWRTIVDHFPNSRRLFLTATPYHKGEYILPDHVPPCFELTKERAIQLGIIRNIEFLEEEIQSITANEVYMCILYVIYNVYYI